MQPLPHSYTNDTRSDGRTVRKRYEGPGAATRRAQEKRMLARLRGLLPVPPLLDSDDDRELSMGFVAGLHGQELIEAGMAAPVLRACGSTLRRIHRLDLATVLPAGRMRPAPCSSTATTVRTTYCSTRAR